MKLCVGLNGDRENAEKIVSECGDKIYELFAASPPEICGSGRPLSATRRMTEEELEYHISFAHKNGLKYNILLNPGCWNALEFDKAVRSRIVDFIKRMIDTGVDALTITNPFIIELVAQEKINGRPKIVVSTYEHISDPIQAKYFKDFGADRFIVEASVQKNFPLLKAIKEVSGLDIEIFVHNQCLYQCPWRYHHANWSGHASINQNVADHFSDPYVKNCRVIRVKDPSFIFYTNLIRPEDLVLYENALGIEHFKIASRNMRTERAIELVRMYSNRKWNGEIGYLCGGIPVKNTPPNEFFEGFLESVVWHPEQYLKKCREFHHKWEISNHARE